MPLSTVAYETGLRVMRAAGVLRRFQVQGLATVLCYHGVTEHAPDALDNPDNHVSLARFREHLQLLRAHYRVIDVHQLVDELHSGEPLAPRTVCLTFDDGYCNVIRNALPLLQSAGLPACLFPTAGLVGTRSVHWPDMVGRAALVSRSPVELAVAGQTVRLDAVSRSAGIRELRRLPEPVLARMLTQVQELLPTELDPGESQVISERDLQSWCAAGFTLGSHGVSHQALSRLSVTEIRAELRDSRRRLETLSGRPVKLLAYPFGGPTDFDDRVQGVAREERFAAAFSLTGGLVSSSDERLALPRVLPSTAVRVDAMCSGFDQWCRNALKWRGQPRGSRRTPTEPPL